MLREQVQGQLFIVVQMSNYPQLILPTREDMIVKIKKHEKIPTLGEVLELRAQAREQLYTVGQLELKNGSIVGSSSM
jgi:hypothetical protein